MDADSRATYGLQGWSCKAAAGVLGIPTTKVSNALYQPRAAFEKIARLMIANSEWTWADLMVAMVKVRRQMEREKQAAGDKPLRIASAAIG